MQSKPLRRVRQIHSIRKLLSRVLYTAQGDDICETSSDGDVNCSHLSRLVRAVRLDTTNPSKQDNIILVLQTHIHGMMS